MCASDRLRPAAIALLGLCTLLPAWGQQAATREQEVIRRLRLQVQQLQQEQSTLQLSAQKLNAEKLEAARQLESAQGELRRLRGAAAAQAGSVAAVQKDLQALRDERTGLQAQLDEQRSALAVLNAEQQKLGASRLELQRALAAQQAARSELQDRLGLQAQGLQACIASNKALHALGNELLQRYADKGVSEVLGHTEPFLQFKRVALENLVQGYQDKLDQALIRPAPASEASTSLEPLRAP